MRVRLGVVADTHAPRRWLTMPAAVARALDGVDLILHAGDVCVAGVLDELAALAPVRAVIGNNDGPDVAAWGATDVVEDTLAQVRVAMLHDAGAAAGRPTRMARRFAAADLVVFGHSHIPADVPATATTPRLVNPGSPTDRRRQPRGTIARIDLVDGRIAAVRLVAVT